MTHLNRFSAGLLLLFLGGGSPLLSTEDNGPNHVRADENWWSLQPLHVAQPPDSDWGHHAIDSFIHARRKAAGLNPSPEADRRTLIRRLSFDLIGLPPTPAEIDTFLADDSPLALERLVDRLLESEHFGERWARHWLDAIGFGESHGFEYNQPRNEAWRYRNWVIHALNRDMPYDEFVRFQLAGDVLSREASDRPTAEGVIATGFLVAGPHNTTLPQNSRMRMVMAQDEMEGRLAAIGQTFLGLTINCARCHDHKFDPVSLRDYYRLAASLSGIAPAVQKVTRPKNEARKSEIDSLLHERRKLGKQRNDIDQSIRQAILKERKQSGKHAPPSPPATAAWDFTESLTDSIAGLTVKLKNGARRDVLGLHTDGRKGFAASVPLPFELKAKTLEVWVQLADLNQGGGGAVAVQTLDGHTFDAIVFAERESKRWMAGSEFYRRSQSFHGPDEAEAHNRPVHLAIVYEADGQITAYRDGKPYGKRYRSRGLQTFPARGSQLVFGIRHGTEPAGNRMLKGRILKARLTNRALTPDAIAASTRRQNPFVPEEQIEMRLSEAQQKRRTELSARMNEVEARLKILESSQVPLAVWAVRSGTPTATHVLDRGDVTRAGEEVAPGGIVALRAVQADWGLSTSASDADRRMQLSRWITHSDNPLFARVIVNRLWHHHFGTGIVNTPNDFGYGGGRPSHPQLLDWLANRLKSHNWSLKALHREIVLSATYRQASTPHSEAQRIDADNRLLWRMSPRRLEAEALRDAMLQVAGKLDLSVGEIGYRDVKEYKFRGSHFYDLIPQNQPAQFRRTIYRFNPRGAKRNLLDTFDCPDPSALTPNRASTITPLQSLSLMNNELVLFLAEAIARRVEREAGADAANQIAATYRLAYGRAPTSKEMEVATVFIRAHSLSRFARVILNSNEFLHVR